MNLSAKHKKMLDEAVQLLSQIVNERESEWGDRSEKWQESEKGDEHQELTESITQQIDDLEGLGE